MFANKKGKRKLNLTVNRTIKTGTKPVFKLIITKHFKKKLFLILTREIEYYKTEFKKKLSNTYKTTMSPSDSELNKGSFLI